MDFITVKRGPQSVQAVKEYSNLLSEGLKISSRQLSQVARSGGITEDPEKFEKLSIILKSLNSFSKDTNHSISNELILAMSGLLTSKFSIKFFITSLFPSTMISTTFPKFLT